jgi:pyridoxamine 5'-phosphate oxidase
MAEERHPVSEAGRGFFGWMRLFGLGARLATRGRLHRAQLANDPIEQFRRWFDEAKAGSGQPNPNAMTVCTISQDGWPEGRPVLLKSFDSAGFVFYTNFQSDKGRALLANPRIEAVFHWDNLGRQIRIRGEVVRVSDADADAYFRTRARGSQIGAWASDQSREVASFEVMDEKFHNVEIQYAGNEVPRPPHWSGFRIVPNRIEFWQADPFRFHDRFRYTFLNNQWNLNRFFP